MVALNESTSELGPRRTWRGYAVTAAHPQGGTGIPAGEMNYPGAAAHMRPAAATGRIRISLWAVIRWGGWIRAGRQLEPGFYNFYGTPEPEYVRDRVQQAEHEVEQQVLHRLCRCATDAAELAGTLASLGVDIDEGVDTFGTSVVVTAPLIATEVSEANTELGRLARDGCVPSYRQLVIAAHSLIFLAGTLVGPPSAANAHPSAPSNPWPFSPT